MSFLSPVIMARQAHQTHFSRSFRAPSFLVSTQHVKRVFEMSSVSASLATPLPATPKAADCSDSSGERQGASCSGKGGMLEARAAAESAREQSDAPASVEADWAYLK